MNKRYNKKYTMTINDTKIHYGNKECMFIAEMMFCLIPQVLRLLKVKCSLSKHPGCFLIKVCWHDFAFSTRLMIFSIVFAIFISISCAVLKC